MKIMESLSVFPAFKENYLTITMQTSEFYAPYAAVTAMSLLENASPDYNYDILFMTWDMRESTEKKLKTLMDGKSNISIRVVHITKHLSAYKEIAKTSSGFERFSYTGMIRLLLPWLLERFNRVLNLDCDMLICSDISELFQYDISNCCMAAVPDVFCYTIHHRPGEARYSSQYMLGRLGLRAASEYINGGFLLLNLRYIRENYTKTQILDFAIRDGIILRCYEQDTFSGLFQDKKILLPFAWNWFNDMPHLLGSFTRYLPPDDPYLTAHREAECDVKNIHYVTDKKPWLINIAYPHAKEWWAVACRGPFLSDILARITKNNLGKANEIAAAAKPRLMFYCASGYQLLNAIHIKYRYYAAAAADLILDGDGTEKYESRLKQTGLFQNTFIIGEHLKTDCASFRDTDYTDFFIPDAADGRAREVLGQFTDLKQSVHVYEGGGYGAYTIDFSGDFSPFREHAIAEHIRDIFLYNLSLHSVQNPVPLIQLPEISREDEEFAALLRRVFGNCALPKEKYIFLQECFAEDGLACNDSSLLDAVANVVGKENIAVRLHPKAAVFNEKLYRLHGYSVYPAACGLWEMAAFSPELEDKVLLSISSTALLSPYLLFGSKVRTVSMPELMPLACRVRADKVDFRRFLARVGAERNKETTSFFYPKSMAELRAVLRYIEGDM